MAKKIGCGRQILGAIVLLVIVVWGFGVLVSEDNGARTEIERQSRRFDGQDEGESEFHGDAGIEAVKWRTWTSSNGEYSLYAKIIKFENGTLTLEKEDGSTGEVELDRLCEEDQEFVREEKWKLEERRNVGPAARVVKVRLVPFTTPSGDHTQMVLVDWRNTGSTTIRAVDADIIAYDLYGNMIEELGITNKPIYAVSDSSPGIAPHRIYREPRGEGYILGWEGAPIAETVEVIITNVVESAAY